MKKETIEFWVFEASRGRNPAECWQAIYKIIDSAIAEEIIIATKEGQPTSRLTSFKK